MNRLVKIHISEKSLWSLWAWWVLATTTGAVIGWFLSAILGFGTLLIGFLGAGAVSGLCIGKAQRSIIENYRPSQSKPSLGRDWQFATVKGGGIGFLIYLIVFFGLPYIYVVSPDFDRSQQWFTLFDLAASLAGGSVLGVVQWRVLRQYVQRAVWWVPANMAGWSIAWFVTQAIFAPMIEALPSPDGTLATGHVLLQYIGIVLATVVYGVLTGPIMVWLFRRSTSQV